MRKSCAQAQSSHPRRVLRLGVARPPEQKCYPRWVLPNDTHPKIEALLIEGYRRMSVGEKMARVTAMSRAVQELGLADVRRAHPHADERELALRLASRRLDAETMRRAFGWDPTTKGY